MLSVEALREIVEPPVAVGLAVERSSPDRANESRLGRAAARAALDAVSAETAELGSGPHGPRWPDGIVGSIAHTYRTAIAVAARAGDRDALGVDIERGSRRLAGRVIERISTPDEREWLRTGDEVMPLVLFCAKEAIYKALSRFTPHPVSFSDVTFEPRTPGLLVGRLVASASPLAGEPEVAARTLTRGGFVVAFVEIEAGAVGPSSSLSSHVPTEPIARAPADGGTGRR